MEFKSESMNDNRNVKCNEMIQINVNFFKEEHFVIDFHYFLIKFK